MAQLQCLSLLCVPIDWWEQNMQHVSMESGVTCRNVLPRVSLVLHPCTCSCGGIVTMSELLL